VSLATWITSILAFFGGGALVRALFARRTLRRMEGLKSRLLEEETERLARAEAEKAEAIEGLTVHATEIDEASLDGLADLLNQAFGDPEDD